MIKKIAIMATVCVAVAAMALDGVIYNVGPHSVTGGVAQVHCKVADVQRLDYQLNGPGKLELVKMAGTNVLSTATIVNAVSATHGTSNSVGIVGAGDVFRLTSTTNTIAVIYAIGK